MNKNKKIVNIILCFCIVFFCMFIGEVMAESDSVEELESTEYIISEKYIERIMPKVNIEEFKSKFNVKTTDIHVYENIDNKKEEIEEGYIKTGMEVEFAGIDKTYIASVIADLNGDGVADQIDLSRLIKNIIGLKEIKFEGENEKSADINNDRMVNQIDITALIRYIVFGKFDNINKAKPSMPEIEVVNGTLQDNGWYSTDVKVKIAEVKEKNIERTTYIITGEKNQAETEIPEDGIITLDKSGEYSIVAYTYDKYGVRSVGRRKEIKIDKTPVTYGKVILKQNNQSGNIYEEGKWINTNVYMELENINEYTQSYELKGATVKQEGQKGSFTIENEGETQIVVKATNKYGNSTYKTYVVKIDKTKPENASLEETGEKVNNYYREVANVKILQGTDARSGINRITYAMSGANVIEETTINTGTIIKIENDGTTQLVVKTYDNAGNVNTITKEIKKDVTGPEITINAGEITSSSISIGVTSQDEVSGIPENAVYTYYMKKTAEAESEYKQKHSGTEKNYVFTGLEQNTSYDIKVEVQDIAGNKGMKTLIGKRTEKVTGSETDGAIGFEELAWSNGKANIKVSTNTSYKIEYQKNTMSGNWIRIENEGTISQIEHGTILYARLTDEKNVGKEASLEVKDITPPTLEIEVTKTSSSITLNVTKAEDLQTGLIDTGKYQYYLGEELKATTDETTYTFDNLEGQTEYTVKVLIKDKAGCSSWKSKTCTTNVPTVEEKLKVGDYVKGLIYKELEYIPHNYGSYESVWKVLYAKDSYSQDNGITLVADEINGRTFEKIVDYSIVYGGRYGGMDNNIFFILDQMKLKNSEYASNCRLIGETEVRDEEIRRRLISFRHW